MLCEFGSISTVSTELSERKAGKRLSTRKRQLWQNPGDGVRSGRASPPSQVRPGCCAGRPQKLLPPLMGDGDPGAALLRAIGVLVAGQVRKYFFFFLIEVQLTWSRNLGLGLFTAPTVTS